MNIEFENTALEELYTKGTTQESIQAVVQRYHQALCEGGELPEGCPTVGRPFPDKVTPL